ncbi:MAG: sensor histidine kinase [Brevundimonas sp.]|nr:sensor histidine kinase [Brevundimonas sp.]
MTGAPPPPLRSRPTSRRVSVLRRLSLAYAAIFVAISALFFVGAMHLVSEKNRERLQSLVFADSRDLADKIDEAPPEIRREVAQAIVGARIARSKERVQYALVGPDGGWIGNLNPGAVSRAQNGALRLRTRGWLSVGAVDRVEVSPDTYVLIGRSQDDAGLERDVLGVALLAAGLAALVAFILAPMAGMRLVRRVEAVNAACLTFGAGDMSARAPGAASQDEFGALARSVNAMFERIEDLVGGLRDVSNRAAHDLRTPIARLRFQLEGVRTASTLKAAHAGAEGALRETDAILATFDALLDIAEIEAGSTLKFRPVDLAEIAGQAVALYGPVAEDAGIALSVHAETLIVTGEPALLVRLVANLIDNGIKFGRSGGRVQIKVEPSAAGTLLVVEDDGPGISTDHRQQVLGRYVREPSHGVSGLGLGLALVAAVARRHSAELVLCEGSTGRGLRVELRFPLADPACQDLGDGEPLSIAETPPVPR